MMMRTFDMHCHLDFAPDVHEAALQLNERGIGIYSCTVAPRDYLPTRKALEGVDNARVGLGMHPWWVASGAVDNEDVSLFCELAQNAQFIGEIGLDFGKRHGAERDRQVEALGRALACCADDALLSLHAVQSADVVLDLLQDTGVLSRCSCIFHWFSGSSPELARAREAGCYFSVNEMMLSTRRGRAYAKEIPASRLLVETDLPERGLDAFDADAHTAALDRTLDTLRELRGSDMREQITTTSSYLLDMPER